MNDLELSELVRKADPFSAVNPRVGAAALARAEHRTARVWPRRFAVAVALVLSSATLAAVARRITADEGGTVAGAALRGAGHAPVAAPRVEAPTPPPAALPVEVKQAPKRPAAPPRAPAVQPGNSTLGEEAELLLKALTQLRVDHDADSALETLDAYDRKFPEGALREDADAARREATAP